MPTRFVFTIALVLVLAPGAAFAQIRQVSRTPSIKRNTFAVTMGYFGLKGIDSRADGDVIVSDVVGGVSQWFDAGALNSMTFGAEYLFAPTGRIEVGAGLAFTQKGATVYPDHRPIAFDAPAGGVKGLRQVFTACGVCDPSGEIKQDLKLRQIPMSLTGRFLILPRGSTIEPYVGAGLTAINYRYRGLGNPIYVRGRLYGGYDIDGTDVGPVVLGGVRASRQTLTVGSELRWQRVVADVADEAGLFGTKFDLGGWAMNFSLGMRF